MAARRDRDDIRRTGWNIRLSEGIIAPRRHGPICQEGNAVESAGCNSGGRGDIRWRRHANAPCDDRTIRPERQALSPSCRNLNDVCRRRRDTQLTSIAIAPPDYTLPHRAGGQAQSQARSTDDKDTTRFIEKVNLRRHRSNVFRFPFPAAYAQHLRSFAKPTS